MAGLRLVNPESPKLRDFEDQIQVIYIPGQVFRDRLKDGSKGPQMVWIAAGSFQMGDIQGGGYDWEKPVHKVNITQDFGMGRYEVTFAEYDKFAEATGRKKPEDEGWGRGNRPVIYVSWHDAVAYAEWLSEQTGEKYRLPTEAEWEYVARAGTSTKYWWGNEIGSNKGNCRNSGDRFEYTAPVGSFKANPFGIYDTVGNVWEWTQDIYGSYSSSLSSDPTGPSTGSTRVYRGGGWNVTAPNCRPAYRDRYSPFRRYSTLGFRLLRQP
ncbi:Sulphatase-modifying factor domain protein [Candidatus Thiomargarita nelsonii]|uniref:Sulphatase-modifying factor domain protein n=1 Tax=Candidatus Thiomargarita nelsonii TaxID=1003181 RepID=A0A176S2R9_9GAMM|nr:Sulphatase-modifying factor domain protein [Candidatus Thiomargarita nelsonii]